MASNSTVSESDLTLRNPLTRLNKSQDHATLSEIAASATSLGTIVTQGGRERQNEESMTLTSSLQPSTGSETIMNHFAKTTLTQPAASLTTRRRLEPVSGPLADQSCVGYGLEHGFRKPSRGVEKPHGRAQKVRGKFTDSRRQEVQNIRKKGACIRCRMLRKTVCINGALSLRCNTWLSGNNSAVERVHARRAPLSSVPECGSLTVSGQTFTKNWMYSVQVRIKLPKFDPSTENSRDLCNTSVTAPGAVEEP